MSNSSFAEETKGHARYDMSGLVAVVTGGLTGIGAEIAAALKAWGAEVCLWDMRASAEAPDQVVCDVSQSQSVSQAVATTLSRFSRIDILVNNAGFAGSTVPVFDYAEDEWRRIIDVNLNGTFLVSKAVAPVMVSSGWGRVVNIASLAGKEGTPNSAAYSASKAGVIAFTKALGKELAQTGVLVNAVAPAAVETELLKQMNPSHVQTMIDKSPMKRLGAPSEVAELVSWLCSRSCSFSTGAVFDLSGGRATY
ncbi:SDR family NAD(P)-dependent oxidoreductase [Neorhizobium sp. NCHU2750]|uniref:SDR family NAD(P)-dependent oxidoreductase n=1 Tax=Neorhizobium sp. NCHU2750 TaxID=1825976 RepID=UPI000E72D98F|nr:3-oxoacyl-ACP reductase [Neorhizobium sp. NCHU2750]